MPDVLAITRIFTCFLRVPPPARLASLPTSLKKKKKKKAQSELLLAPPRCSSCLPLVPVLLASWSKFFAVAVKQQQLSLGGPSEEAVASRVSNLKS